MRGEGCRSTKYGKTPPILLMAGQRDPSSTDRQDEGLPGIHVFLAEMS